MRNVTAFLIGVGILVATGYGAPNADPTDKQKRIDAAKREVVSAEARARAARREVQDTQRDLDNAIRFSETSAQSLKTMNDAEGQLTRDLSDRERDARQQKDARDRVVAADKEADRKLVETRRAITDSNRALEDAKKQAEQQHLESTEAKARLAKIDSAQQALQQERDRVLAKLGDDAGYRALKSTAITTESAVKALREQSNADAAVLARASKEWLDAKAKLESAERTAFNADPAYMTAEEALSTAKREHESALAAFRQSLPAHPVVGPLFKDVEARTGEQTQLLADQKRLATEIKQSEESFKTSVRTYDATGAKLKQARLERDKLALQAQGAERTIETKRRELSRDELDARDAERDLDAARRRLRDAERS